MNKIIYLVASEKEKKKVNCFGKTIEIFKQFFSASNILSRKVLRIQLQFSLTKKINSPDQKSLWRPGQIEPSIQQLSDVMTRRPERYRLDCNRRYISNAVYCDIITEARWRRERVPFGCWPMGAESRSVINGWCVRIEGISRTMTVVDDSCASLS
ncbi:hypothetical protein CEXT_370461 [Caerostris extrusa]|uniref:Uncharacterized protein n=1 Tax=Caerostris extrusa TaxID=172846 RepID=A0AAV4M7X3_CAEEX|nr:hypothetical protein CEXT_370461 [Caerostris extrusa]